MTMETTEFLVPGPAVALARLLDLPAGDIEPGWPLPPLWHWLYFLERPAQSDLGPEGHDRHGIPRPPRDGLRRMYAGGRTTSHRPLLLGEEAESRIDVVQEREREGRSGRMTVVTTRRTVRQRGEVAVTDEVDIIYRVATRLATTADVTEAPATPVTGTRVEVDEAYLFRFSALTYNSHRIHYDVDYCRDQEDYPGLVVHGPLQALLMSREALRRAGDPIGTHFAYRLVAPLILGQGLVVDAAEQDGVTTARVRDRHGRTTASSRLTCLDAG
ncbi:mesaconyl-C4 CoA hydratase [Streptomyces sp. NBC_01198]|uniref:mesaconyl-C4 CoA hydratase n=1 Tax=Streptomyces sp. NBC_01198 TaxID=2903769 RepID=UPI002E14481B|nr:mesaconyl-C4 CoA hydratase [Streptomyces sp. NBC_01198]